MKKRTLCIGDIHGALKALKQCLERANFDPMEDELIFLGDYSDGWSETAELIEFLIELSSVCTFKPIFILGNHDSWTKEWLVLGRTPIIWTQQGGKATIESYIRTGYLTKDSHREFFQNCLPYYIDDKNRGFVHGGFKSRQGLGHDHYAADYYWDRDLWNLVLLSDGQEIDTKLEVAKRYEKHTEIFIGHTSTINWNNKPHYKEFDGTNAPITVPMNRCNVWNLDTGGGFGGKVTAMDIETKQYWQSDFVKNLYPDQKGR